MQKWISVFGSEHDEYSNTIIFRFTEYISESSRPKYPYIIGCSGTSDETLEGGWNVCDEASYLMKHG